MRIVNSKNRHTTLKMLLSVWMVCISFSVFADSKNGYQVQTVKCNSVPAEMGQWHNDIRRPQRLNSQEGLCPDGNHPHIIDLGLPSGTKWACCNVGASSPIDYGGYYAWGETEEKDVYNWSTYIYCDGSEETCHNIGSEIGGTPYDVAYAKWGKSWQLPTIDQFVEIDFNCTTEWIQLNGVNGRKFTGPNGNSIFFPATGYCQNDSLYEVDSNGYYWSGILGGKNYGHACYWMFGDCFINWGRYYSCDYGRTVRPVFVGDSTVDSDLNSFSLGTKVLMMDVGETVGLTYTFNPNGDNEPVITWRTNDNSVALVSAEGYVTAVSEGLCTIIASCGEDLQEECLVLVGNTAGTSDGHDYVDLGLPSGTLWATTNLGAGSPEDEGISYQWDPSSEGDESDRPEELASDEDKADNLWGAYWRTPSLVQMEELVNSKFTTITQISMNGVDGFLISSLVNGKIIFLPAASNQNDDTSLTGHYWSRTLSDDTNQAYELILSSGSKASLVPADRSNTYPIRPVYEGIATSSGIVVSSGDLNFGTVAIGSSRSLSFDIWNNTYERQEIEPFALNDADFFIDWNGGELEPNATQHVTVTYSPTSTTIATGGLLSIGTSSDTTLVSVFASSHKGYLGLSTKKHLVVWGKDGSQTTFVLNEKPVVTVDSGIIKVESTTTSAEFSFNDILKLTYEGLIEQPSLEGIDTVKAFEKTADALTFYSDREDLNVQIVSLGGLVEKQFRVKQGSTYSLPLSQLSKGVYVISVNKISYKVAIR